MSEDPAFAAVEGLFGVSRRCEADPRQRVEATFAMWICNCWSDDDTAPKWLVYDRVADGGIAWCRLPDRTEPLDLIHAKDTAGNHTSPAHVLLWLQRVASDPWAVEVGGGDVIVLETLRDKILAG